MKYLLDTDIVIDHLKGKKTIDEDLAKAGMAISIITHGELVYGAYRSHDPKKTLALVKQFIRDLAIGVMTLNEDITEEYARLKAHLETKGKKLDDFDLLIAATARKNKLILVTNNLRHFSPISGLTVRS